MKFSRFLQMGAASLLLFTTSCSDETYEVDVPKGAYENGILIINEGLVNSPAAEVAFLSNDLALQEDDIYKKNNGEAPGNILQTIGFSGDHAYLVLNVPNKIEVVNRYTFKKVKTVTEKLDNPRYIAFTPNNYYVTNNDFFEVRKLNIYRTDHSFVKSIDFPRYAEKVVEAGGNIVVQTDGSTYDSNYNELPTGHTVTIINGRSNDLENTVTFPDTTGIIKDMISFGGYAYVLSSDATHSYIHKVNGATGAFTTTTLSGIAGAQKLRIDGNKFYFITSSHKVYNMDMGSTVAPTQALISVPNAGYGFGYGFDVIDGKIFIADSQFAASSKARIYNAATGAEIKTINTGIGTNGFYWNK